MKIMDKKENYDKMLKNNRVEKKTDGVESDRELRKALLISIFLSLSIILQIAESFIFIPLFLPGIKLGLANIVTIIVLYVYGIKEAAKIGVMRIFLAGILRNSLGINFLFSLFFLSVNINNNKGITPCLKDKDFLNIFIYKIFSSNSSSSDISLCVKSYPLFNFFKILFSDPTELRSKIFITNLL